MLKELIVALERHGLNYGSVQILNVTPLEKAMVVTYIEHANRHGTSDHTRVAIVTYDFRIVNSIIAQ